MNATVEEILRTASEALVAVLRTELEAALSRLRDVEKQAVEDIARCRLLSKKQVRVILNCSLRQLNRWIADGMLPIVWLDRRPRFDPRDIEALVQKRKLRESPGSAARRRVK